MKKELEELIMAKDKELQQAYDKYKQLEKEFKLLFEILKKLEGK